MPRFDKASEDLQAKVERVLSLADMTVDETADELKKTIVQIQEGGDRLSRVTLVLRRFWRGRHCRDWRPVVHGGCPPTRVHDRSNAAIWRRGTSRSMFRAGAALTRSGQWRPLSWCSGTK